MTHTIIATISVPKENFDKAAMLLKKHAKWVLENEEGTIHYYPHKIKGESKLVVYEHYKTKEAFDVHSKNLMEHMSEFVTLASGGLDIQELEGI